MKADAIVAALADNPPTAELLSGLAPEVQENIKRGWTKVLEENLATEATPTPVDPPAPGATSVAADSPAESATPGPAQS